MADAKISALTDYSTPLNADVLPIVDTANVTTKKVTWTNIKATLKTYFDTLYQATLVSATNIKTINSNSILGSGDLVISASVSDGDKGDITVSSSGTVWNIDAATIGITELSATGTPSATTFLRGDNAWSVPAGAGDVSKVGTPANNQIGVWTGDGTIEGDAALTFDTTTDTLSVAASGKIAMGAVNIIDDSAGTTTLSNIDALDATTEATIESAIDTLANLTSIQGRTVTLADAGANAIFGWDDVAGAYENLTQSEVKAVIGDAVADGATKGLASFTAADFDATSGNISIDYTNAQKASTTQAGFLTEIAIDTEVTTGTDATRAVSPDALAGSTIFGRKAVSIQVTDGTTDVATGDGKAYFTIPESLNGMNLVRAQATVVTAGTTNATTIMIHNKTDTADMLSVAISIASAGTVGTVGTVNGATDDVATNDVIRIDVDSVSTTAPKGLVVVLEFQLP